MATTPTTPLPRLYAGLAAWWPLFSRPEDYAEEAAWILNVLGETLGHKPRHILELGAGGGNIASHIIPHVPMTLTDLSGRMLEISRRLNPNTEHFEGDMRSLRLGKTFDAVIIHDAIMYMTTARDLVAALATRARTPRAGWRAGSASGLRRRDVRAARPVRRTRRE